MMTETLIYSAASAAPEPSYPRLLPTYLTGSHRGALFLTYDDGLSVGGGLPVFPTYRSDDHGSTWSRGGDIADQAYALGHRYQPNLLELHSTVGQFPAGTLLASGNAIPSDLSQTRLPLYASQDGGQNWTYLSEIDAGGPAEYDPSPQSTTTAVWEPELLQLGDTVICYYSDERFKDRRMLQTLVQRSTTDLRTWTPQRLVFGVADRRTRPGMLVTTAQLSDGQVLGVLEIVGGLSVPVQLVRSSNGRNWGASDSFGHQLISRTGTTLSGSPTISAHHWDKIMLLLATGRTALDATGNPVNRALYCTDGVGGQWTDLELPVAATPTLEHEMAGYSQSLVLAADGHTLVHATGRRNAVGNLDIVVGTARLQLT